MCESHRQFGLHICQICVKELDLLIVRQIHPHLCPRVYPRLNVLWLARRLTATNNDYGSEC
ncbi:hypothetical protein MalM25_32880 [Planctomycetes bacterium MalM25]|nr:hypothetical protein MalM25_32880 [Planctomycetes bacterium MalM25]